MESLCHSRQAVTGACKGGCTGSDASPAPVIMWARPSSHIAWSVMSIRGKELYSAIQSKTQPGRGSRSAASSRSPPQHPRASRDSSLTHVFAGSCNQHSSCKAQFRPSAIFWLRCGAGQSSTSHPGRQPSTVPLQKYIKMQGTVVTRIAASLAARH